MAEAVVSHANVELVHSFAGPEWRCTAGQRQVPIGCNRHAEHFWCKTCEGWYGIPHDDIHTGPNKHPTRTSWISGCVCRPCLQHPLSFARGATSAR